ncbi:hypothetical protein NKI41_30710, partial [Mesorhizobium sp. M0601]
RARERDRRVPVMKMGSLYFVWWSKSQDPHQKPPLSDHNQRLSGSQSQSPGKQQPVVKPRSSDF